MQGSELDLGEMERGLPGLMSPVFFYVDSRVRVLRLPGGVMDLDAPREEDEPVEGV